MLVKKYCAFGCPVYTVYNIQSSCKKKRAYTCTLEIRRGFVTAPGEIICGKW